MSKQGKRLEVPCAFGTLVAEAVGDVGIYDEIEIDLVRPNGTAMQLCVAGTWSGEGVLEPELHIHVWDGSDESPTISVRPNMETAVWY